MNDKTSAAGLVPLQAPSSRQWRAAAAAMLGYALILLALSPLAHLQGPAMPQAVTIFTTGIIVTDVATAFLLLQQLKATPAWSLLLIGCAFIYSALMAVAHLLTFPGALVAAGPVLGGDQLAYRAFNLWKAGFAALILAGAIVDRARIGKGARLARLAPWLAAIVPLAIFGLEFLLERRLPQVIVPGGRFTGIAMLTGWSGLIATVAACAWLWTARAHKSQIFLWVSLAMTAFCGDILLSALGAARFSVGWYVARASGLASACILFLFFLVQSAAQQRAAVQTAEVLRERTERLEAESLRRAEAEERLTQAQKLEAMGHLTGGIAHDFNNLLAAVIGNLDLLIRRGGLEPRPASWAASARGAAERGVKLTSQLLVFARAQRLELRPVDAAAAMMAARPMLLNAAGPRIGVVFELAASPRPIVAEPSQLELAVLNLFINARDAMPDGGAITLRTEDVALADDPELEPGDYLLLTVTDTGQGMAPEVLRRAFDPFFTTKDVGKGTGLGLSQVFGFTRRVGGTARAQSRPGEGARVQLYFRRADEPAAVSETREVPVPPIRLPGPVLVVDDDAAVRDLLATLLDELGLKVIDAVDGPRGLIAAERWRPALLIADFAMPGMNGAQLAQGARALIPGLPVVFVTGYADTDAIEAAVGQAAPILRKPFALGELREAMAKAMAQTGQFAEP